MPRANDTYRANDRTAGITIGRDHHRTSGIREQIVFGTDENLHAVTILGRIQQTQGVFARFQRVKQTAYFRQIISSLNIFQQI